MKRNYQPDFRSEAEGEAAVLKTYEVASGPTASSAGVGYPHLGGGYSVVPTAAAPAPVVSAAVVAPVSQPHSCALPHYALAPQPQVAVEMVPPQPKHKQTHTQTTATVAHWCVGYNDYNWKKKSCIGFCLTLAIAIAAIALIVDALVYAIDKREFYETRMYCGWKSYRGQLDYEGSKYSSSKYKYAEECHKHNDWCDTEEIGEAWFGLSIVAILVSAVPLFGIGKLKQPIELFSAVLVCIAMLVFYDEKKNMCWGATDYRRRMDVSGILMIAAIICWVLAAILRYAPIFNET